jgi:hypothetical protein
LLAPSLLCGPVVALNLVGQLENLVLFDKWFDRIGLNINAIAKEVPLLSKSRRLALHTSNNFTIEVVPLKAILHAAQ